MERVPVAASQRCFETASRSLLTSAFQPEVALIAFRLNFITFRALCFSIRASFSAFLCDRVSFPLVSGTLPILLAS